LCLRHWERSNLSSTRSLASDDRQECLSYL